MNKYQLQPLLDGLQVTLEDETIVKIIKSTNTKPQTYYVI